MDIQQEVTTDTMGKKSNTYTKQITNARQTHIGPFMVCGCLVSNSITERLVTMQFIPVRVLPCHCGFRGIRFHMIQFRRTGLHWKIREELNHMPYHSALLLTAIPSDKSIDLHTLRTKPKYGWFIFHWTVCETMDSGLVMCVGLFWHIQQTKTLV